MSPTEMSMTMSHRRYITYSGNVDRHDISLALFTRSQTYNVLGNSNITQSF